MTEEPVAAHRPLARVIPPGRSIALVALGVTMATAMAACAGPAAPPGLQRPIASVGQGLAQRQCGQCHAVGPSGASPLADAPRFVVLRARISRDALAVILRRRMTEVHPRMPAFFADEDEVAHLLDYWDGLPAAADR